MDKPGILIVGCTVYGGTGTYDFELEMFEDQQDKAGVGDKSKKILGHFETKGWVKLNQLLF